MLTRILGESERRTVLTKCFERIWHPLDRAILKIMWFKKIEICMRVGEFRLFFRPFVFSDTLMLFADYEPYTKRVFQPRKGETVIDVGAHIGIYTLSAARNVGNQGIVVSFEPDQRNFRLLEKNIKINGFGGVKLFNVALDENSSRKTLYMTVDPLYSSMFPSAHTKTKIKVETTTLDSVAEKLKLTHIDWVKIDVEGNELNVLEGGKKAFSNLVDRVIIETSNAKAIRFLSKRDFKIQRLSGLNYLASKVRSG
jgi:FkbM family methyltransferase